MHKLFLSEIGSQVGLPTGYLLTRSKGEQVYEFLKNEINRLPEEATLHLDFTDIYAMDVSFVDEAIIRLGKELVEEQAGHRRLLLHQLSQDAIDNINAAIALQKLTLGIFAVQADGSWQLIGHIEKSLHQVLLMIMERNEMTAPQLAMELDLALNAANNRLKRLYDQRLIQRRYEVTEKGLLYIYNAWRWEE